MTSFCQFSDVQLTAVPEGTTKCPYQVSRKRGAEALAAGQDDQLGEQDWRWQQRGGKRPQQQAPIAAPSLGECACAIGYSCAETTGSIPVASLAASEADVCFGICRPERHSQGQEEDYFCAQCAL
jgi:hypothetical protein